MKMEKIKKESVLSLILPYTVTKNAYKETAHIVLILSQDEILDARAWEIYFSILFYYDSIGGEKSLYRTSRYELPLLLFFISGL